LQAAQSSLALAVFQDALNFVADSTVTDNIPKSSTTTTTKSGSSEFLCLISKARIQKEVGDLDAVKKEMESWEVLQVCCR